MLCISSHSVSVTSYRLLETDAAWASYTMKIGKFNKLGPSFFAATHRWAALLNARALSCPSGELQISGPRSALEKDPRPGPLFEGNPVGEGTTRRGTATPVHPDPSSKATLWVKAQHEGALPPPCPLFRPEGRDGP